MKSVTRKRLHSRKKLAQSTMELIGGLIILVPIILFLIDLSTIVLAAFKNDSVCREACRAAASGDPKDSQKLAEAEISKYNQAGSFASYSLSGTQVNGVEPNSGQGLISGDVSVKTTARVHAPFIIGFVCPTVELQAEQSFPFTFTRATKSEPEEDVQAHN